MLENVTGDVQIVEVGPRDGLQNEAKVLETEDKFSFIVKLAKAGFSCIEATSFVRHDRVPQMADGEKLFSRLTETPKLKGIDFPVLIPNLKGLEKALKVKA
ncbi:MAG: hydroxymethylglutaryl-CoA lyase, partial [Bacteriovoracales bacterium]|nr:hydroxymethylglutaryl-CoA lyase [Bacteriovoracales bacterium]